MVVNHNQPTLHLANAICGLTSSPVREARLAAKKLSARERVPGVSNAAIDGYALRASDTLTGSVLGYR